ncbi:MAG TPA: SDR family NAD(P)-dependent oxidoreductase, partial [Bryobacteraceae bacterium]|nr:SDR family NAD(P)-dependent oxidoreductase [Bryobacteraceae bacterium]
MKEFRNRVAVVTGAASGIGRALAVRFAAEGMKVVLADVEEPALQAAAQELRDAGAAVLALRTDVSQEADVEALAVRTYEAFGGAHIVCNNAGVASRTVPSWEQTSADWQWVLSVNLWGVIHGIRAFVPRMLSSGGEGHIVNTASLAGLTSSPGLAPYNASKHAVATISESLYFELLAVPSSIRVSVLCPGWVNARIV